MNVAGVMTRRVITVRPNSSFTRLWRSIFRHHINALPVVDKTKKLVGIITREDILKSLYPNYRDLVGGLSGAFTFEEMEKETKSGESAKTIMNRRVVYTRDTTPLMRVLSRMIVRGVDQLPVLDEEDRVVGMITKGDIFYALFRKNFQKKIKKRRKSS